MPFRCNGVNYRFAGGLTIWCSLMQLERGGPMRVRAFFGAIAVAFVMIYFHAAPGRAQTSSPLALSGRVRSAEERPMEGVLLRAQKASSTDTLTLVTHVQRRALVPSSKVPAG